MSEDKDSVGFQMRLLVPNLCTLVAACAGLNAIRMSIEQHYDWAVASILLAVFLDGIDGRLARFLDAESKFGAEFDSLADFVNFGVAPGVLLYAWGLSPLQGFGWAVVTAFTLACGVRLARFNATLDDVRYDWQKKFFTGVPAPAGAILVLLPYYLDHLGLPMARGVDSMMHTLWPMLLVVANTLGVAFLLVSRIPTFSGKHAKRAAEDGARAAGTERGLLMTVAGVLGLFALLYFPYQTLTAATLLYLGTIPNSIRRYRGLAALSDSDVDCELHDSHNARP